MVLAIYYSNVPFLIVVYGWSSDALGFLVEKVSGQTLDNFWYDLASTGRQANRSDSAVQQTTLLRAFGNGNFFLFNA